jgi:hypothetical protein
MDTKAFSARQALAKEPLAEVQEVIRAEVRDDPSRADETSETLQDYSAVFGPAETDFTGLGASELVG